MRTGRVISNSHRSLFLMGFSLTVISKHSCSQLRGGDITQRDASSPTGTSSSLDSSRCILDSRRALWS